jgi:riboflavin synthase
MFTGLIQGMGVLRPLGTDKLEVTCLPQVSGLILPDLALGDSVAVDGVCLTVVEVLPQGFVAVISPETRDRATLGTHRLPYVNLETSLRIGSKLGGHFVTGHVDGIAYLETVHTTDSSWKLTFTSPSPQVARYIIPKGSVSINGISLTIASCNSTGSQFTVAVIPHTYAETNLQYLHPGSPVNLEGDILGKYVEKFVRLGPNLGIHPTLDQAEICIETISSDFLMEHGY